MEPLKSVTKIDPKANLIKVKSFKQRAKIGDRVRSSVNGVKVKLAHLRGKVE